MRDGDVRVVLIEMLRNRLGSKPHVLVPEVDIRWSVPARMDVLLVSDRIAGFEIKSDADSLHRLSRQIDAYGDVVERAHLVVGRRHQAAAIGCVPDWWSVWSARWSNGEVRLCQLRRGRLNPSINPLAVTTFLSRRDLTNALQEMGERRLSSKSVDDLRSLLVDRFGSRRTLALARTAMLSRADWQQRTRLAIG